MVERSLVEGKIVVSSRGEISPIAVYLFFLLISHQSTSFPFHSQSEENRTVKVGD